MIPNFCLYHSNAAVIMDDYEMIMGKVERLHLQQWITSPNSSNEREDEERPTSYCDTYIVFASSEECSKLTVENLENSDDADDDSSVQHAGCVPYDNVLDRFDTVQACQHQDIFVTF
jgi:hypothetical protein